MSTVAPWRYLIALGSNQRHPKFGAPRRVLAAALERLEAEGGSSRLPFVVSLSNHEGSATSRQRVTSSFDKLMTNGEGPTGRVRVIAAAPTVETAPVGPSIRRYANSAAVIETELEPEALLTLLKRIEREFGRRQSGQRWRARVLDLDVVLWSGGPYPPPLQGRGKGWGRSRHAFALTRPTPTPPLKGRGLTAYASPALTIPHPLFRTRGFVLAPAVTIAPDWRDPLTGLTVRQLHARLTGQRAQPKRAAGEGP